MRCDAIFAYTGQVCENQMKNSYISMLLLQKAVFAYTRNQLFTANLLLPAKAAHYAKVESI